MPIHPDMAHLFAQNAWAPEGDAELLHDGARCVACTNHLRFEERGPFQAEDWDRGLCHPCRRTRKPDWLLEEEARRDKQEGTSTLERRIKQRRDGW